METYAEFLNRLAAFEPETMNFGPGNFQPNPSVLKKVDAAGKFKAYYGDTVVFDLEDAVKQRLKSYLELLYQASPESFGEKLSYHTLHLTLHDLNNAQTMAEIQEAMEGNEKNIAALLSKNDPSLSTTITMRSTVIFNMVNTSLVLGLIPINAVEYEKLMNLYGLVDTVHKLPYPLTPHITLAYFSRNGISEEKARELERIINELNKNKLTLVLDTAKLIYQRFTNMNHYHNVLYFKSSL